MDSDSSSLVQQRITHLIQAMGKHIPIRPLAALIVAYVFEREKIWLFFGDHEIASRIFTTRCLIAFDPQEKSWTKYEIQDPVQNWAIPFKTPQGFIWSSRNKLVCGEFEEKNKIVTRTISVERSQSKGSFLSFFGVGEVVVQLFSAYKNQIQKNRLFQNGVWSALPASCSINFEKSAVHWNPITWTLLVFGGHTVVREKGGDKYLTLNTCFVMTKLSGKWEKWPSLIVPRAKAAVVFHGLSQSYLISGGWVAEDPDFQDSKGLDSIERFDIKTQQWSLLTFKLPTHLWNHWMFIYDNDLIILGKQTWICNLSQEGFPYGDWNSIPGQWDYQPENVFMM